MADGEFTEIWHADKIMDAKTSCSDDESSEGEVYELQDGNPEIQLAGVSDSEKNTEKIITLEKKIEKKLEKKIEKNPEKKITLEKKIEKKPENNSEEEKVIIIKKSQDKTVKKTETKPEVKKEIEKKKKRKRRRRKIIKSHNRKRDW